MCGRYSALTEDEIIEAREIMRNLSLKLTRDNFVEYSEQSSEVFPTNYAPNITSNSDGIAFESVKWGFKK